MTINENDIEIGWIYKTPNNQERLVLTKEDGKIIYSSRGGNVKNKFDYKAPPCEPSKFATDCSEKVKEMPSDEFDEIKKLFEGRNLINK
ncbi:hypothetical protein OBN82_20965 [Escherichia coli]|uniref:hypothetical protein n=1 Tax=Escherichia coli TaxID=562 RepID=UPI0021D45E04|nr:hypothetical protein [Escherichia coli]MCU7006932.1 hypothetical protein [Escherichia coli]